MRADTIEGRTIAVVRQEMGTRGVTLTTRLVEDLNVDSLDRVNLWLGVEEEFGVVVPEADPEGWSTVGAIASYVARLLAEMREVAA